MSEVKTNKITSLASNNDITLDPDGTGDVVVASGHKLGVGETAPLGTVHIRTSDASLTAVNGNADDLILENNGNCGMSICSSTSGEGNINFIDSGDTNIGRIQYTHSDNNMIFRVNDTERMRIESGGNVLIGRTSDALANEGMTISPAGHIEITRNNAHLLTLNRKNGDGSLIIFAQDNSTEGNITVAGSTVSLTGGHLARWSRLTSGNRDAALVKGTVMTNLDQMVVWSHAATDDEAEWTEDNEQLNCMAISSVEGDPNVAGVFVSWDEDDDFNDMHVGQTGDMVIRIAQGTTVARGDLLMSAGDGTAKPQDDDIVRSKTIAKVTSTTKSHTYDDGSYLVPCVLMAC